MGRIVRRGSKAIAIIDKKMKEKKLRFLKVGSPVEVTSNEEGLRGAWYEAKIVSHSNREGKFPVKYKTLVSDDDPNELLTETIGVSFIRPVPPPRVARQIFEQDDVVDAFHRDGWWQGVVSKVEIKKYKRVKRRRYTVDFQDPTERLKFNGERLRFHHVWLDGRWVKNPKQKVLPNEVQCEEEEEEKEESANEEEQEEEVAHEEEAEAEEDSAREEGEQGGSAGDEEEAEEESAHEEEEAREEESACEEERSPHVSLKGSSTSDNHVEEQSSVKKRKNPLEQLTSSTTSTAKKLKMSAPETEGGLPIYSNKFRTENRANILSPDECHATSMLMDSAEQVTDSTTFDTSGNVQLARSNSPNNGKSSCPKQQEPGSENGMTESSKKSEMNAQVTGQQVPTAAVEDKRNEDFCEVTNEGNAETFNQSSSVNGQAGSEPVKNKLPPFTKTLYMWKHIDSLEIFRIMPQKPRFKYLSDVNEPLREGAAIGHMLSFESLAEKVTKLQIDDPISLFHCYLDALAVLEDIGFDVKTVVNRVNELLPLKRKQEELDDRSKEHQSSIAKCHEREAKLNREITAIDKMGGLAELRASKVSQMVEEDSKRAFLQLEVSSIKAKMSDLEVKFKVKSAAPWQRVVV